MTRSQTASYSPPTMSPRILRLSLASLALVFVACSDSGIGAPCNPGNAVIGNLRVVLDTGECSTNVCVSYLGSPGYCSVLCDTAADCPQPGYICCPVVQTGAMTSCTRDDDCSLRQRCRQNVCKPKQLCVQASGSCQ